jgi:hypothetical protein
MATFTKRKDNARMDYPPLSAIQRFRSLWLRPERARPGEKCDQCEPENANFKTGDEVYLVPKERTRLTYDRPCCWCCASMWVRREDAEAAMRLN